MWAHGYRQPPLRFREVEQLALEIDAPFATAWGLSMFQMLQSCCTNRECHLMNGFEQGRKRYLKQSNQIVSLQWLLVKLWLLLLEIVCFIQYHLEYRCSEFMFSSMLVLESACQLGGPPWKMDTCVFFVFRHTIFRCAVLDIDMLYIYRYRQILTDS